MKVHIATSELVVIEMDGGETADKESAQNRIRSVLEDEGFEPWSSIEIEDYTYRRQHLMFAKPIKVLIPGFLSRLLENTD